MSKRTSFAPQIVPENNLDIKTINFSKWIPLLCAGAAAGVSIIALKEIQNIRKELNLKKEQEIGLSQKMESLEEQLKTITNFLKNGNGNSNVNSNVNGNVKQKTRIVPEIIKSVVPEPKEVNVINEDEYEEVEVTDDESED